MKKNYTYWLALLSFIFFSPVIFQNSLNAQCNNSDFSSGNFTGWTGTYGDNAFDITSLNYYPNPTQNTGFNQGPLNASPGLINTQWNQVICSAAGGNDPYLGASGGTLPMVWPGNAYSARIGSAYPSINVNEQGEGETITYTFLVTASNCNFTYHYAVALAQGAHLPTEQPFFKIRMKTAAGVSIDCASFDVNGTTAASIGGFDSIYDATNLVVIYYKPWSSVFIPLNNYLGQTVSITFTCRSCYPCDPLLGCYAGSHFAYAYVSAECAPLTLVASSPTVCGGTNITLSAPAGAATYAWSGPGIVSGGNTQVVTVDQPGPYSVTMTTFGNNPCTFTLDTIAPANPHNPSANFIATNACVGNSTQFTDKSTPVGQLTSWAWDFNNDGVTDATTQNPTYTFPAAGTYPVKLTVNWPPCTADTIINVVVTAAPDAIFTATSPVCEGTNSNIVYTGADPAGDTYTWTFDGGTVASGSGQGPYQVNWLTGGNKNITLVVTAGNCSSPPSTQVVVVNPFPGLIAPPDTSVCTGGSVTLTASGATTYTWSPAAGLNTTTGPTVIATPASATTYTVTGVGASCSGTATVNVAVNPFPTSPFSVVTPVCAGQNSTITYTGNAGAGATYMWNFNGGNATPASGQGPFQVNWNTAGVQNVSLTVAQSGCTSTQTTVPVTVNPNPVCTFTVSSPLCTGQNGTVTFTGSATGTAVYNWGWSGGTVISGTGAGPYTVNWATAGTPNVTLSISDNGCNANSTVPVTVYAIPTSTFTGISPVCELAYTTLTYTGTGSVNATYNWGFAGGTATPGGTTQGPQLVNWATAGVQTVTLTVSENGCTGAPFSLPITVNPYPSDIFTVVSPICNDQTTTVTYTGSGTVAATYTWSFDGGIAAPGTGQGPQIIDWASPGIKNITLVVSENGCTSPPTTMQVDVRPIPTATFTVTTPLCFGKNCTVTYTGTSSAAATFTWGFSGGTVVSGNGSGPYQINWNSPGIYEVSLALTDSGCVASPDSTPVTINAIPLSGAGADTAYCSGGSVPVGTTATAGYTYQWSPASGLSDATASNPMVGLTNTANSVLTQTYTVTTTSNNCTSSDAVVVTVNPMPVAHFTHPAPACLNVASYNFTAGNTFLPGASIVWSFANATPPTSTALTQAVTYNTAGTNAVTLLITQGSTNCISTYTDSVAVYAMPQAVFQPDTVYGCENFEVCFLNNSVSVPTPVYLWNFGDGAISGETAPCHLYVAPGVYSVFLQVTSGQGCVDSITKPDLIKVIADPIAQFTSNETVIQQPQSEIDFTNQSLNSVTYLWTFNAMGVDNGIIGSSTDINPKYNFTQYGLYNVMLYSYNALGCKDSAQEQVTVLPPQNFFIPNVFTPNGDGNNDEFYPFMQEGATLRSFKIFDRWGEKVHDGLYPWDGNYKDKKAPAAVYIYVATIHLATDPGEILRKGSVTLVR